MSEAERQQYYLQRKEFKEAWTGVRAINYATQKGEVVFLNAQKRVAAEPLSKRVETISDFFHCKFGLKSWDDPITLANAAVTSRSAGRTRRCTSSTTRRSR